MRRCLSVRPALLLPLSIAAILATALHKHGLGIVQTTDFEDGALTLITRLVHTSGQWIESRWPMPAYDKPQAAGAVLSYFRRYAVASLLGLSPEEDTDAQHTESPKRVPLPARKVEPKPEPAPKVPAAAELPRQEIPPDVTRVEGHVIDLGKTTGTSPKSGRPHTRYVARLDASDDRFVTFDTRLCGYLEDSRDAGLPCTVFAVPAKKDGWWDIKDVHLHEPASTPVEQDMPF